MIRVFFFISFKENFLQAMAVFSFGPKKIEYNYRQHTQLLISDKRKHFK